MPFDVEIVINVLFTTPDGKHPAQHMGGVSEIRLLDDGNHQRWHVHGKHDHRFPGTGPLYLIFNRDGANILLLNKYNHAWAELKNFPHSPTINSKGDVYLSNLNYASCPYTSDHRWLGNWWINQKAHHKNMPLFDPNSSWFRQMIDSCSDDTGWRYDTSSGVGGSGGAIIGGGYQHQSLIFKRKEEHDTRRWAVKLDALGVGFMTPGVGVSGSAEAFPSTALTELRRGPGGKIPFPITDLAGPILFFDGGFGAGVGKGKVGVGAGLGVTTYIFLGGSYADGTVPMVASVKALLQTGSTSGGGGKSGGLISAGAQGLVYGGKGSVTQR